jgi:hypothetical protein
MFDLHVKLVGQEARIATLDDIERQLAETRHAAEEERARAARLDAEVSTLTKQLEQERANHAKALGGAAPGEDEQTRAARQRFTTTHNMIRAQLADAPRKLLGRIPEAVAEKKTWKQKLSANAVPFRTVLFDPEWIAQRNPSLPRLTLAGIVRDPRYHAIDSHPLFAAKEYLERNFDVAAAGMSPLQHYVLHGWREGRNPHRYFANDWYLQQNPDVLGSGRLNPLDHYLRFGWREGRWPNPVFDPRAYLDRHPDVDQAGTEPLTHYVTYGQAEGREPQLRGLDANWKRFVPASRRALPLMDYLLQEPASPMPAADKPAGTLASGAWPAPLADYRPPQRLLDFIVEGYGEEAVELYGHLLSVMEAFHDRSDHFSGSDACNQIMTRLRLLAKQKAVPASGTAGSHDYCPGLQQPRRHIAVPDHGAGIRQPPHVRNHRCRRWLDRCHRRACQQHRRCGAAFAPATQSRLSGQLQYRGRAGTRTPYRPAQQRHAGHAGVARPAAGAVRRAVRHRPDRLQADQLGRFAAGSGRHLLAGRVGVEFRPGTGRPRARVQLSA